MRICQPPENVSVGFSRSSSAEAEAAQHRRDLQLDAVAVAAAERVLQLAVAREHRLVLVVAASSSSPSRSSSVVHLRLHVEQRLEREARFFAQRAAAVDQAVLRQVADRQPGRLDDRPAVGLVDARRAS